MSAMSNFLETKLLDHVLRNVSYTPPATVYVALYTVAASDTGGGTEVTGGSYARQSVAFGVAASPGGTSANTAVITFTNMPACTVVSMGIFDAVSAGNLLLHAALTTNRVVAAAENLTISIGDLIVTFA